MMIQYTKLLICTLSDGKVKFDDQILLINDESNDSDYWIDFTGDFLFNLDFEIIEIKETIEVESILEIEKILNEKMVTFQSDRINNNCLFIGSEKSFVVNENLLGRWR